MMTVQEITDLRKAGEIDKAYAESRILFESNPDDRFAKIVMSQSLKALMDRAGKAGDADELARLLDEYGALGLEETDEAELNNKAAWDVRTLLITWKNDNIYDAARLDRIAQALTSISFVRPHRYFSILLDAFVKVKDADGNPWPGIVAFIDWWGLDNLLPEDFERVRIHNGQVIPSLAERAYTAYVKALIEALAEGRMTAEADAFIHELDAIAETHPEFQYTDYYKTLLLKSLDRMDEAVVAARTFVKRRQNESWAWSMLGDIVDDPELKLSCYCRALLCRADRSSLIKVRQKAAFLMYEREDYSAARREFDNVLATCQKRGWRVPPQVEEIISLPWYEQTQPEYNNLKYYHSHLAASENFLCGDVPEIPIIIVKNNPQKNTCSFITADRQRGFFFTKKMKYQPKDNHIYLARFPEGIQTGTATKLMSIRKVDDVTPYEGVFFRRLRAELNIRPGQTFTFIDDIYVDSSLLHNVQAGDMIDITAVIFYNIKRESWGWRALRVTPAE